MLRFFTLHLQHSIALERGKMYSESELPETIVFPKKVASSEVIERRFKLVNGIFWILRLLLSSMIAAALGIALGSAGIGNPPWVFPVVVSVATYVVLVAGLHVWHYIPFAERNADRHWETVPAIAALWATIGFTAVVFDWDATGADQLASLVITLLVFIALAVLMARGIPEKYHVYRAFAWLIVHVAVVWLAVDVSQHVHAALGVSLVIVAIVAALASYCWVFVEYVINLDAKAGPESIE